jgi:class 3 adenylate cyclase
LLDNGNRLWKLAALAAAFSIPLLLLDYYRMQAGLMRAEAHYFWLFISHLATFFGATSAVILFRNNVIIRELANTPLRIIQLIYLVLFFGPLFMMGMLSYIDRNSLLLYGLITILLNILFTIHLAGRIFLNLSLFAGFSASILYYNGPFNLQLAPQILECAVCVLAGFFIGQLQYQRSIRNFSQELEYQVYMEEIALGRRNHEELLLNLLPKSAVLELKKNGYIQAKTYERATVCIVEFSNFKELSNRLSAVRLVRELNRYYETFDRIVEEYGLERMHAQTMNYVFTAGIPEYKDGSTMPALHAAVEIMRFMDQEAQKEGNGHFPFSGKIGIHCGPVGAGVVGNKRFSYEIWGETVYIAAQIKKMGEVGGIYISENIKAKLLNCQVCHYIGTLDHQSGQHTDVYHFQS